MPGYPLADAAALWPMNSLGDRIFDLSGNRNRGMFSVADPPRWIADYINFDVGVERILVLHNSTIDFATEAFFVTVCFRTTNVGNQYMISKNYGGVGVAWYAVIINGGELSFQIDDGVTVSFAIESIKRFNDGEWHIVTGIRNTITGNMEIYIDGVIGDTANPDLTGSIANAGNLFIGCRADLHVTRDFVGDIRFVNIHHYSPEPSEIALSHREPYCMYPEKTGLEFLAI